MMKVRSQLLMYATIVLCFGELSRSTSAIQESNTTSAHDVHNGTEEIVVRDACVDPFDPTVKSPCSILSNHSSGEVFVNCQKRKITKIDPRWFPPNTTSINLDYNNIHQIENNTFSHLSKLQILSICNSNVEKIQVDALQGLKSLTYLKLEKNKLPLRLKAFPKLMFRHVPALRHLYIWKNDEDAPASRDISLQHKKNCSDVPPYSHYIDIFDFLPDLRSTHIDAFVQVCIGNEFRKFPRFTKLGLHGPNGFVFLTNETFLGLQSLTVTCLHLDGFVMPTMVETGLFQPLSHLDSVKINGCHFGNQFVAKLFWPFVKRNMSTVLLDGTSFKHNFDAPPITIKDGMIRKETLRYLGEICISHLSWTNSKLFAFEPGAFTTSTWRRCLKTLDLSDNFFQLTFWKVSIFDLLQLYALESITVTSPSISGINNQLNVEPHIKISTSTTRTKRSFDWGGPLQLEGVGPNVNSSNMSVNVVGNATDLKERVNTSSESGNVNVDAADTGSVSVTDNGQTQGQTWASGESSLFPAVLSSKLFNKNVLYISLPRNLKSVRIDNLVEGSGLTNPVTFIFRGGENLQEIHLTRMPGLFVTLVNVFGLGNVKLLDLSYSLVQVKTETLFDNFLGIEILLLRSLLPNNYFDSVMPVKKLIRNMTQLRYLEIAQNDLNFLLPGTFSTNPQLTHLILAENRFTSIPFDLRLTPKLEVLDLSRNAIMYLDGEDIAAITAHVAVVKKFILKLEGNNLVCVCSQFKFLAWVHSTSAILDNEGNYTCSSQDGTMATTLEFSDMRGFWRQCNGWSWLMMSIVLALVLLVSLLTTYLTSRFRCAIRAFMLRMMFPQFRPMKPQDYRTDVIVCYADDDFRFVRNVLQGFLEGDLNLRTHIHQRDLDVGGYKDDQFCEAIENSWRVLLIITENFLHNYDMADIVMKFACYGVGPANQGRVFALVEQTQLDLIPRNLHAVLDDNRIIVIHDLDGPLGYEQKQSIQNCLRPVN